MDKQVKVALILSAVDKASSVVSKAMSSAEKSVKSFDSASKKMNDLGNKSIAAGVAVTAGIGATLKAASDLQKKEIALNAAFQGNKKVVGEAQAQIEKFYNSTNVSISEATDSYLRLQNLGLKPSVSSLLSYQSTSIAMNKTLNDMIEAVADAATFEFERLKEFGIKSKQQGDYVKFTFQGVTTTVRKNALSIQEYLQNIGNTKFAGLAEKMLGSLDDKYKKTIDKIVVLAGKLGTLLVPMVNTLNATLVPLLDKLNTWISNNPELAAQIMKIAAVTGLCLIAFGSLAKIISSVITIAKGAKMAFVFLDKTLNIKAKTVSLLKIAYSNLKFAIFAVQYAMKFSIIPAVQAAGAAISKFGMVLLASPITWYIAAAALLAGAVYLIVRNWGKISGFFSGLWTGVKNTFTRFFNWLKSFLPFFGPFDLIVKHWDKIGPMFVKIWDNVKGIFNRAWEWIAGLGSKFWEAGKNILKSVWEGMKSMAMAPVNLIANMVKKIRDFLPFSPAKVGPLKDIHRIRLVETIAQSVKPKPLLNAWGKTVGELSNTMREPARIPVRPGGSFGGGSASFSITINMHGGGQADAKAIGDNLKAQLDQWWNQKQRNQTRIAF